MSWILGWIKKTYYYINVFFLCLIFLSFYVMMMDEGVALIFILFVVIVVGRVVVVGPACNSAMIGMVWLCIEGTWAAWGAVGDWGNLSSL